MPDATAHEPAYFIDIPELTEVRQAPAVEEHRSTYSATLRLVSGVVVAIRDGARSGHTVMVVSDGETGATVAVEMTEVETNRVRSSLFQAQG